MSEEQTQALSPAALGPIPPRIARRTPRARSADRSFGPDRYADTYRKFRDNQEWFAELFRSMTFAEYNAFVGYCFREVDHAAEAQDSQEFTRIRGLLFALALKDIEIAHFMIGLPPEQRGALAKAATAFYQLAKSFYPVSSLRAIESTWATTLDHAARFGYASRLFSILPPYRLFRDPDRGRGSASAERP